MTALHGNLQGPKFCCKLSCTESSPSHYLPLPTSYFSLVFRIQVGKESINIDLIKESSCSVQVQIIRSLWATYVVLQSVKWVGWQHLLTVCVIERDPDKLGCICQQLRTGQSIKGFLSPPWTLHISAVNGIGNAINDSFSSGWKPTLKTIVHSAATLWLPCEFTSEMELKMIPFF